MSKLLLIPGLGHRAKRKKYAKGVERGDGEWGKLSSPCGTLLFWPIFSLCLPPDGGVSMRKSCPAFQAYPTCRGKTTHPPEFLAPQVEFAVLV